MKGTNIEWGKEWGVVLLYNAKAKFAEFHERVVLVIFHFFIDNKIMKKLCLLCSDV